MNEIHCDQMLPLLSAFYDGELPEEKRDIVSTHLKECSRCRETLNSFQAMSTLAAQLSPPDSPDQWPELRTSLVARQETRWTAKRWHQSAGLRAAAILLLAIGLGLWGWQQRHSHHLEMNFDGFLTTFTQDVKEAEQRLISQYQGKPVSFEQAVEVLRYRPAVVDHMPADYRLISANLLTMPCCQCLEATFKGPNGNPVCIFEHDLDQPVWFGNRASIDTICCGKKCRLIQVDGTVAATWKRADRFLTIIGPQNLDEMVKLIAQLDPDDPAQPLQQ